MEKYKSILLLIVVFPLLLSSCKKENNVGLIGVYYNKVDLTYPKQVMMLEVFSQKWNQDVDYKAGSAAVWKGYLKAPFTGEVIMRLSSTKKTIVKINGLEMVAENNTVSHTFKMSKGKAYPIEVIFINTKNGIKTGEFKMEWSWAVSEFNLVGPDFLFHTKREKDELTWLTDLDKSNFKPENFLKAVNTEHRIVYYEKGGFGAWPANNGTWSWGNEILVSFSKGSYKSKPHQHSYDETKPNKRVFARSLDGGETWKLEEETVVYNGSGKQLSESGEIINFMDPNFAFTSNGDQFAVSYDRGKTWPQNYIYPDFNLDCQGYSARTDYVVLNENTCRIFIASEYVGEKGWAMDRAYMLETDDGGKTLDFISWIAETDTFRSVMPSSVKITDDHMITALRRRYDAPKGVNHSLRQNWIDVYETKDGGRTWHFLNKIANTDRGRRNGNPPALVRLSDGTLCVAYGYRGVPCSIRARTSTDNGKTWSKEIIIRDDTINWDMGYVRMVARPDDKVVLVYYYSTKERKEQHIEATIWNPKDITTYQ